MVSKMGGTKIVLMLIHQGCWGVKEPLPGFYQAYLVCSCRQSAGAVWHWFLRYVIRSISPDWGYSSGHLPILPCAHARDPNLPLPRRSCYTQSATADVNWSDDVGLIVGRATL